MTGPPTLLHHVTTTRHRWLRLPRWERFVPRRGARREGDEVTTEPSAGGQPVRYREPPVQNRAREELFFLQFFHRLLVKITCSFRNDSNDDINGRDDTINDTDVRLRGRFYNNRQHPVRHSSYHHRRRRRRRRPRQNTTFNVAATAAALSR